MIRVQNNKYRKTRKPIISIICEGRNKTESTYLKHFIRREHNYNLKIFDSVDTDIRSFIKKAKYIIDEMQLDVKLNDKVFCLVDLDLSIVRYKKVQIAKQIIKNNSLIQFILSNPCFEVRLLYYFTKDPKVENSSQKVKEQLRRYVPQYNESYDIVEKYNLLDKTNEAIKNAELKNQKYDQETSIIDRNPYTEIPKLLNLLLKDIKI